MLKHEVVAKRWWWWWLEEEEEEEEEEYVEECNEINHVYYCGEVERTFYFSEGFPFALLVKINGTQITTCTQPWSADWAKESVFEDETCIGDFGN